MVYNTLAVGDALREIREQYGYTQSDMAENLEISCIHYAAIEQGRHKMSLDLMLKIVSLYGVGLEKLFGEPVKQSGNSNVDKLNQKLNTLRPEDLNYVVPALLIFLDGFKVRKEAV